MMESRIGHLQIAKQSVFSYSMFALSASTLAFTSLQGGNNFFGIIVALSLGMLGLIGSERFKVEEYQPPAATDAGLINQGVNIAIFAGLALMFFEIFNWLVPRVAYGASTLTYTAFWGQFTVPLSMTVAPLGQVQIPGWLPGYLFFAVLIPNMEEQFFRGFWGNLAIRYVGAELQGFAYIIAGLTGTAAAVALSTVIAAIPAGVLFGAFHTPAYNGSLLVIATLAADGTMIMALDSMAASMDVGIIAHMVNNSLSFIFTTASILNFIPGFPSTPIHAIVPLLPSIGLFVFGTIRKQKRRKGKILHV